MEEISILIGGKAGFGIDTSGLIIARILSRMGFYVYVYRDYPSIIRGGHTFSIIRASSKKISSHRDKIDIILALNQDTIDFHKHRLKNNSIIIYNSDLIKPLDLPAEIKLIGVSAERIIKEESASELMRNTCVLGGFCKAMGIGWSFLEDDLRKNISKEIDINLKVAYKGYSEAHEISKIMPLEQKALPILSGNEAIGLGLIKAGLNSYISYPMTPSSGILHYLAELSEDFSLKVVHPESEIAVMLMALGASYAGDKVAVGTSGGGFCLMTEGLSFCGMAELPVVIIVGQRTGPSTGLPTYTGQSELFFVLYAGQGEFSRFVTAPADSDEAYYWAAVCLNISSKYHVPSFVLTDKTLSEGVYSFDIDSIQQIKEEKSALWDNKGQYKRYLFTETGVSPLVFAGNKGAVVKINSYEHDESGITTENADITEKMQKKRIGKAEFISEELENYKTVNIFGNKDSSTAVLCWGSNRGVCIEAAVDLGLKVIQPVVLCPFPLKQFQQALNGVKNLICVENNAAGQLSELIIRYGYKTDKRILKYNGRPFTLEELYDELEKILKQDN